jgi:S1-C subfamily serine protease
MKHCIQDLVTGFVGPTRRVGTSLMLAWSLSLIAACSTFGQGTPAEWPAVCRVAVHSVKPTGEKEFGLGTGTLIGQEYVLTAKHNIGGAQSVSVHFPATGERSNATVSHAGQPGFDIAVLRLAEPPRRVAPMSVARSVPQAGESVTLVGFGGVPRKGFRALRVSIKANNWRGNPIGNDKIVWGDMESSGASSQGDSGGPVVNSNGELVGVISGSRENISVFVTGTQTFPLRRMLSKILPPYGVNQVKQTQYAPGGH